MDWVERFDITVDKQLIDTNMENPDEIVDNDFKREHTLYVIKTYNIETRSKK